LSGEAARVRKAACSSGSAYVPASGSCSTIWPTVINAVLAAAGTSKGAFFHHFTSKDQLGQALIERYARSDLAIQEEFMAAAEAMSDDPAEQLVGFVSLFEEAADELVSEQSGCLYVSFVYERQLVDDSVHSMIEDTVIAVREQVARKLEAAIELHPPRVPVDVTSLADLCFTIFEGGFILARTLREPSLLRGQLTHLRRYLELLFEVGDAVKP
jgi:TetR/AcrR family transcriptional repressor of nem operon